MTLPPWWILKNVKPAGDPRDMGGWTAVSFTTEQQDKFGVNESGEIVDQDKHAAAITELDATQAKKEWPELVGMAGDEAVNKIGAERPELSVSTIPDDAMMTMDWREDRVRVFVNADGQVSRPPTIG